MLKEIKKSMVARFLFFSTKSRKQEIIHDAEVMDQLNNRSKAVEK